MPIFAFLFVFVFVYALLQKTKVIGDSKFVSILLSFILAIFFVVNASLVEFVKFNAGWFAVFLVCILFILILVSFTHGKIDFIQKPAVGWVLIAAIIIFFIISSSYTFNWAINLGALSGVVNSAWAGFILLLIVAGIASWILTKK